LDAPVAKTQEILNELSLFCLGGPLRNAMIRKRQNKHRTEEGG
jgi:hypothetical protein